MANNTTSTLMKCVQRVVAPRITNASLESLNGTHVSHSDHHSAPWVKIVLPIICFLGILGNVLNLLVLTRKRMRTTLDRLEKSANFGLVALALSDMLFCVIVLPHSFISNRLSVAPPSGVFPLYYRVYGVPLINVFLMGSTWLIVVMAINRYIVVVFPLHARDYLGSVRVTFTIVMVFVVSFVSTVPTFLPHVVSPCYMPGTDTPMYQIQRRWNRKDSEGVYIYTRWVWPVLSTFIPLLLLLFCNARLIQTLRKADIVRKASCKGQVVKETNHKVTLTLVIIVLMYFLLVLPSEILKYVNPFKMWGDAGFVIAHVTNLLQAANFAFNFVLYCCVNAHFRHTITAIFTSCCRDKSVISEKQRMLSMKSSMPTETVYSFSETTT